MNNINKISFNSAGNSINGSNCEIEINDSDICFKHFTNSGGYSSEFIDFTRYKDIFIMNGSLKEIKNIFLKLIQERLKHFSLSIVMEEHILASILEKFKNFCEKPINE